MGYITLIAALMLVLPIVSTIIEFVRQKDNTSLIDIGGRWFIFWGVGVRLLIAGAVQIANPSFTAAILQMDESSFTVIRELGFANTIFGVLGIISVAKIEFRLPATAGGFYMGLAGIMHIFTTESNQHVLKEYVAMISDLWIFLVMLIFCAHRVKNHFAKNDF